MADSQSDQSDEWEEMEMYDEEEFSPTLVRQTSYNILGTDEIQDKINTIVRNYSEVLGVSYDEALIMLFHYRWKAHKLQDDWLENEYKTRVDSGISIPSPGFDFTNSRGIKLGSISLIKGTSGCCQICLEPNINRDSLQCGHAFCTICWEAYLTNLVYENMCINALCPSYACNLKIPDSIFYKYLKPEPLALYERFKQEGFVSQNASFRWCSSPGCKYIIEYPSLGSREVKCKCSYVLCFVCGEEAHRPANCSLIKEWKMKNSAESENINWILANTKQCPTCRKPIEKNQGCNHMTCRREAGGCGNEFCWLCLGPWTDHNSSTGGFYRCNKYEEQINKSNSQLSIEEKKRCDAKSDLDKYMWYYERFNNHEKAQKLAQTQVPIMDNKMQLLHDLKYYPIGELEFLKEAAEQVAVNRRVLKWTYVFGYYLSTGPEKNLFEHLQEKLEENTEHLHELVEKPLDGYLDPDQTDRSPFYQYKSDLINYVQVTKKFLENLLDGIENGLIS